MAKMQQLARLFVLSAGLLCAVSCGNSGQGGQSATDSATSSSGEAVVQYTVRFNPCGGSKVQTQVVKAGDVIRFAPSTTRDGYQFLGWCSRYDGAQGEEGSEVTFPYTVNANATLYARWARAGGGSHTQDEIDAYLEELDQTSEAGHLYVHYYRFDNDTNPQTYNDFDIWAWPMLPDAGEGYRFDWVGRTTSADKLHATGDADADAFGGAYVDIDLNKVYKDGGWNNTTKTIGGFDVDFRGVTQVGIQIVKSESRINPEGKFWTNDGGDQPIDLTNEERVRVVETQGGGKAYHIFALQFKVASYQNTVINDMSDPFEGDTGKKVTRGQSKYSDVKWDSAYKYSSSAKVEPTASSFANGVGVGYQIQVATFADSDGDGYGDIYGIQQKLDYLAKLGVKALWLTPVQKSDSYHGYDIIDYEAVDKKFGSTKSPNAINGRKTDATAMKDYEDLIAAAHAKGMKIVMDLVLNHTSISNKWFVQSAQLNDSYRGYYQWGNQKTDSVVKEVNCWFPYIEREPSTYYSYYAKFGYSMPELNYQYQKTRDAVVQMALNWCKKGVDGYRLDAVKHVFMNDEVVASSSDSIVNDIVRYEKDVYAKDEAGKDVLVHRKGEIKDNYTSNLSKNLHFYRELNARVKAEYPNCFFVGENFDGNAYNVSPWYSGFDSMFDFYGYFNLTTAAAKIGPNASKIGGGNTFENFIKNGSRFSVSSGGDKGVNDKGHIYDNVSNKYTWDLTSVINSYNYYRKGNAMPGFFTSNHDIARVINRIASTKYDANGLSDQGNINSSNYGTFRKYADLVKATEILLPGLTWIYYGDEIGMTGNFPSTDIDGNPFTSESAYADLYWRQPMKWTQGGKVNDGSMTTGLSVTGSGKTIEWDSINSSAKVAPANSQMADPNSEFSQLAKVVAFKNSHKAMITGQIQDNGSTSTVWKFKNGGVDVIINFNDFSVTAGGSKIANFNF